MAIKMINLKAANDLICRICGTPPFAVISCLDTNAKTLNVTITCHKIQHSISLGSSWSTLLVATDLLQQIQQAWDEAVTDWEKNTSTFARSASAKPKVETKEIDYIEKPTRKIDLED